MLRLPLHPPPVGRAVHQLKVRQSASRLPAPCRPALRMPSASPPAALPAHVRRAGRRGFQSKGNGRKVTPAICARAAFLVP